MTKTRALLLPLLCLALRAPAAYAQPPVTLKLATWNLRLDLAQDGVSAWPQRKELVKSLVRYHDFDVFATQEGLPAQIADMAEMKEFAHVGAGRDDGKHAGEHSAIFYKRSRIALLRAGDFWLSQTPATPSLGWDATCCKRIVSWAELRDRNTGRRFFFFSVHFDHQGEQARRESAKLVLRKIAEIAGAAPVICAGDFNSAPDTEQIHTMQGALADAYLTSAAPPYGPAATFSGFRTDGQPGSRIDYIFVSRQVAVRTYAALTDSRDGRYFSDHLPVVIAADIAGAKK
jgi:endonuclease/exonuclease/phosphatase family metal-dependent hydrolase